MVVIWPSVVHLLAPILCAAMSLYLLEGFEWNLPEIFIMWLGIARKVFKVKGQSYGQTECCNDRGIHFDDVALSFAGFEVLSDITAWPIWVVIVFVSVQKIVERNFLNLSVDKFVQGIIYETSWMYTLCTLSHSVRKELGARCSSEKHQKDDHHPRWMSFILLVCVQWWNDKFLCILWLVEHWRDVFLTRSCCVWDDGLLLVTSDVIHCLCNVDLMFSSAVRDYGTLLINVLHFSYAAGDRKSHCLSYIELAQ